MALLIIASFLVTYLYGQEITKTTMSCITETPEPTMRTVDKLKDTWDAFVKSYCEGRQLPEIITANFTPTNNLTIRNLHNIAIEAFREV